VNNLKLLIVKDMKKIIRHICYLATGINISLMGIAIYLSDLNLLLLSGPSALLTLFGAIFVFSEEPWI